MATGDLVARIDADGVHVEVIEEPVGRLRLTVNSQDRKYHVRVDLPHQGIRMRDQGVRHSVVFVGDPETLSLSVSPD